MVDSAGGLDGGLGQGDSVPALKAGKPTACMRQHALCSRSGVCLLACLLAIACAYMRVHMRADMCVGRRVCAWPRLPPRPPVG